MSRSPRWAGGAWAREKRFADVLGRRMAYIERGEGHPIVVPVIAAWNVAARVDAREAKQSEYNMAKSVNKVILVGNVGQDPEVKYTPSGVTVGRFSLATNERFKDSNDQWQDRTEWHNIVAWQRLAEIVGEYVRKGTKLYVEGKLQTTNWEDRQNGEKKYRTEIVARDIVLLSSRDNGQNAASQTPGHETGTEPEPAGVDDDIPF